MKKEQVDLENAVVWIPDSKTPNGIAEVPLTDMAIEAFREQIRIAGPGAWLFPSDDDPVGHQKTLNVVAPARRREGVRELLANETAGEEGGSAEAEPEGQRGPVEF